MRKLILISICLLLFACGIHAQHRQLNKGSDSTVIIDGSEEKVEEVVTQEVQPVTESKAEDTLFIDTTVYYNRLEISPDSIAAWKSQKAFGYIKNLDSLLKARQQKQPEKQKEPERSSDNSWLSNLFSSAIFQAILWIFAIAFVLFILYNLFLTESAFRKKTTSSNVVAPVAEEEVIDSKSDFASLIKQAVQQGNYRLAIRYQYLLTLHKLADKQLVQMAADKTNYQYVREISNQNYQNDFSALTLNYEYVWYGEFAIDEMTYRRLETGFTQFNQKL